MKRNDSKLIKRLIYFTKGYRLRLFIALLFMLGMVICNIFAPFIIGKGIDEFLSTPETRMIEINSGAEVVKSLLVNGRRYTAFDSSVPSDRISVNGNFAGLFYVEKEYYLFTGLSLDDYEYIESNKAAIYVDDGKAYLSDDKIDTVRLLKGVRVDSEALKDFFSSDFKLILLLSGLYLIVILLQFIFTLIHYRILLITGQKIIYNIREIVYNHFMKFSFPFFDKHPVGKIVTPVTNDIENINEMYRSVIVNFFRNIFVSTGLIVALFVLHWKLTLYVVSVVPVIVLIVFLYRKYLRSTFDKMRKATSQINTFLSENLYAMKIIQIFHIESERISRFFSLNRDYYRAMMKNLYLFGTLRPLINFFSMLAVVIILYFGGGMFLNRTITFGLIFIFISYIDILFEPIMSMAEQFNVLQSALASADKVFNYLDMEPVIKEDDPALELENFNKSIEFKNVWFAYNDEDWVIKDLSFRLEAGKTLALVGATGAGKTSITNLILRFYDIQKGQILIDGVDIRRYSLSSLRRHITPVLQDVIMYSGTILDNIRLKNDAITEEEVVKAAEFVNADTFISKYPDKYQHRVTERGSQFSTGQRQLISFARAIAFNPSILILDEATSNIDTETEKLIQNAISKMIKNKTNIVIAHRLSTIQNSDKILVLHKGKLMEEGTHQELLKMRGLYYKLYQLQFS